MTNQVAISHFKSHCLEIIKELQTKQQSMIITKRDKPIAKIEAINQPHIPSIFGCLSNKGEIKGDIIEPINEQWDAEND